MERKSPASICTNPTCPEPSHTFQSCVGSLHQYETKQSSSLRVVAGLGMAATRPSPHELKAYLISPWLTLATSCLQTPQRHWDTIKNWEWRVEMLPPNFCHLKIRHLSSPTGVQSGHIERQSPRA